MTDQAHQAAPSTVPEPTGVAALDAALAEVATLEDRPVAEHVAAFETAHAELRRPLDHPPAELDAPDQPDQHA